MTTKHHYNCSLISIVKMPLNETTSEGSFYAKVNGGNIGVNGRTHWESENAALMAAKVFIDSTRRAGDGK